MKIPSPMHYAVKMALEDGLAALDAGTFDAFEVPSGVVAALKTRRSVLCDAGVMDSFDAGAEALVVEFDDISALLDAISARKDGAVT